MMFRDLFHSVSRNATAICLVGLVIACSLYAQPVSAGKFCSAEIAGIPDGIAKCVSAAAVQASETKVNVGASNFSSYLSQYPGYVCASSFTCVAEQGNELCASVAKLAGESTYYACAEQLLDCKKSPMLSTTGLGSVGPCPAARPHCCEQVNPATQASDAVSSGSLTGGSSAPEATSVQVPDPLSGANVPSLIGSIVRTFVGIAGSIALAIFVWGGLSYIFSGGESSKVKAATEMLRNAAIGIVLIFGAYMLTATIINAILIQNT